MILFLPFLVCFDFDWEKTSNSEGISKVFKNAGGGEGLCLQFQFNSITSNVFLSAADGGGCSSGCHAGTSGTGSVGRYSSTSRKIGIGRQPGPCNTARGNYHGDVGASCRGQGCGWTGIHHGEWGEANQVLKGGLEVEPIAWAVGSTENHLQVHWESSVIGKVRKEIKVPQEEVEDILAEEGVSRRRERGFVL